MGTEFVGEVFGECGDADVADGTDCGAAGSRGEAGDVYDASPSALFHDRRDGTCATEVSEGFGVEVFVESFVGYAFDTGDQGLSEGACGVVHEDVDAAKLEVCACDHAVDRFGI